MILERCVRQYHKNERYKQDKRFVQACVKYADTCKDAETVFDFMEKQQIGSECTFFYVARSANYETSLDYQAAERVFEEGLRKGAQPIEELQAQAAAFQRRMEQRAAGGLRTGANMADITPVCTLKEQHPPYLAMKMKMKQGVRKPLCENGATARGSRARPLAAEPPKWATCAQKRFAAAAAAAAAAETDCASSCIVPPSAPAAPAKKGTEKAAAAAAAAKKATDKKAAAAAVAAKRAADEKAAAEAAAAKKAAGEKAAAEAVAAKRAAEEKEAAEKAADDKAAPEAATTERAAAGNRIPLSSEYWAPALGKCTACNYDALPDDEGSAHIHPKLGALLCDRCYNRVTRVFTLDVRDNHAPSALLLSTACVHLSLLTNTLSLTAPLHCPRINSLTFVVRWHLVGTG